MTARLGRHILSPQRYRGGSTTDNVRAGRMDDVAQRGCQDNPDYLGRAGMWVKMKDCSWYWWRAVRQQGTCWTSVLYMRDADGAEGETCDEKSEERAG